MTLITAAPRWRRATPFISASEKKTKNALRGESSVNESAHQLCQLRYPAIVRGRLRAHPDSRRLFTNSIGAGSNNRQRRFLCRSGAEIVSRNDGEVSFGSVCGGIFLCVGTEKNPTRRVAGNAPAAREILCFPPPVVCINRRRSRRFLSRERRPSTTPAVAFPLYAPAATSICALRRRCFLAASSALNRNSEPSRHIAWMMTASLRAKSACGRVARRSSGPQTLSAPGSGSGLHVTARP